MPRPKSPLRNEAREKDPAVPRRRGKDGCSNLSMDENERDNYNSGKCGNEYLNVVRETRGCARRSIHAEQHV